MSELANSTLRRSFHYRDLEAAGASFRTVADAAAAWSYGDDAGAERARARTLGIADLSPLPRTGFKGRDIGPWLTKQKVKVGEASNLAYPCGKASLAAKLAPTEVLLLGAIDGSDPLAGRLDNAWTDKAGLCFPVPRRDASFWFTITGDRVTDMFAKICGVDLRAKSFENRAIAQTSVARSNAIIIRDDLGAVPAFHMLGDSASAGYMWMCLLDAMVEFDGGPVGLEAVLALRK
jgi:sarcosine oxidase subunit gamma